MKAMKYMGPRRVRVEDAPEPIIEHPMDVIVKVKSACICGSDLHLYHGAVPDTRAGSTFGHEFIGEVVELGHEVKKLKLGDMVLVPFNIACGSCFFCQREMYSCCHESNAMATAAGGIFGYSHTAGGFAGGQAEYVRVPYADVGPTVIPQWMHPEDAVLLTDVVPTGYHAAVLANINLGDTVVVFGAGPIGIMAARCCWLFGAGRVIVVDHLDYRLEFVRRYAQCETYNFKAMEDPVAFLKRMTDGLGLDSCIDAVGSDASGNFLQSLTGKKLLLQAGAPTALHWAINSVRKGGSVSVVGVYGPTANMVPIGNVLNKGITIRASQTPVKKYLPRLIEHLQNQVLTPRDIITHRLPLDCAADAYRMFSSKLDGCIKPILLP